MRSIVVVMALMVTSTVSGLGVAPVVASSAPASARAADLTLATFNIRTSERGGPAWTPRRKRVLTLLRRTRADVVVLQEAAVIGTAPQRADGTPITPARTFPALWLARKAGYRLVGSPAGIGHGSYYWPTGAQILYRPGRLALHPAYCDVGYTAASKIATFTDRSTRRTFRVVGAHLRPGRGQAADESRNRSLGYYDRFARLCDRPGFSSVPTAWLADMNTPQDRAGTPLADNLRSRGLRDSIRLAERRSHARLNTFHPSRRARLGGKRLDQIWVPRAWRVTWWTQVADVRDGRYLGRFASDHNPVVARVRLR